MNTPSANIPISGAGSGTYCAWTKTGQYRSTSELRRAGEGIIYTVIFPNLNVGKLTRHKEEEEEVGKVIETAREREIWKTHRP